MTTRDYLLEQARDQSHALRALDPSTQAIIKVVPEPTRMERAQILYAHLYNADLPVRAKQSVVQDARFLTLIDHKSWTARLVSELVDVANRDRLTSPPERFFDEAMNLFDHPQVLWEEAFERHLDEESRAILIVLATMPREVAPQDLELAF